MSSTSVLALEKALAREAAWRQRRVMIKLLIAAACLFVLWISAIRISFSATNLLTGIPNMADFFGRMFPPHLSYFAFLVGPTVETVQIAAWAPSSRCSLRRRWRCSLRATPHRTRRSMPSLACFSICCAASMS